MNYIKDVILSPQCLMAIVVSFFAVVTILLFVERHQLKIDAERRSQTIASLIANPINHAPETKPLNLSPLGTLFVSVGENGKLVFNMDPNKESLKENRASINGTLDMGDWETSLEAYVEAEIERRTTD